MIKSKTFAEVVELYWEKNPYSPKSWRSRCGLLHPLTIWKIRKINKILDKHKEATEERAYHEFTDWFMGVTHVPADSPESPVEPLST